MIGPNIKKVIRIFFPNVDCEYIDFTHMSVFIQPHIHTTGSSHTDAHSYSHTVRKSYCILPLSLSHSSPLHPPPLRSRKQDTQQTSSFCFSHFQVEVGYVGSTLCVCLCVCVSESIKALEKMDLLTPLCSLLST